MLLLTAFGCASIGEGYTARYGLTNPESTSAYQDLTDEAYASDTVGDRYVEEYERKYHDKDIIKAPAPAAPDGEEPQP